MNRGGRGTSFGGIRLYLMIALSTMVLLVYVTGQLGIITLEKAVLDLRRERVSLDTSLTILSIEAARLRTGGRIRMIAQQRLGLRVPEGAPEKLF